MALKIYLIGFMGCGKTYWGDRLAKKLSLPFFDLDAKIEEHENLPVSTIFEQKGEEYFRLVEKEVLYMITDSHEAFVMATGGGTPCFYNNIDYVKKNGISVWINCSVDCLYGRLVKDKQKRPLVRDIPDAGLLTFIIKKYSNRKIFYQQADKIVHDDNLNLDELVERIFHQ